MDILVFILAAGIGGMAAWQAFKWRYAKKISAPKQDLAQESMVLLERIEKVFKVVLAEGYFTEIYDHKSKKDFFGLFKTNSKALVVAKAKVAVGYDFGKMRFRRDHASRTLVVEHFADPEIIAIDTDYTFYDINQGLLNKFDNEDYTEILAEAKKLMQEKAQASELPDIAQKQIELMMQQLCASVGWQLEHEKVLEPIKTLQVQIDDNKQ
ncbi:DUF4230 domain-containing protein [Cellvibrio fontiphilus]|uniref:DUF4230 domain-containing protein n=1 Tax=Cellvibrio fontiphilus TaxID=1815559 RepID=A0ABV7FDD8_9GAMM